MPAPRARRAGPIEKNEPAGAGTATLPMSEWLFVPLATAGEPPGRRSACASATGSVGSIRKRGGC